jgi:hypothetical protein
VNPRKLVGAVVLGLLLLLGLGTRYIAGVPQEDWGTLWKLAYVAGLCIALFTAFYDRKNFPEKAWDFDPKRGIFYFLLGWIIFPLMMVIDAVTGADFSLRTMVVGTFLMSVFVGIAGTFTENVGV